MSNSIGRRAAGRSRRRGGSSRKRIVFGCNPRAPTYAVRHEGPGHLPAAGVTRRPGNALHMTSFGRRRLLLGHPVRAGNSLSSRSAYRPNGTGPRRGLRVPHARAATGGGALSIPGTAVLALTGSPPARPAAPTAGPEPRDDLHPCGAPNNEASIKGSHKFTRPIFPSPVAPGWISSPFGFPRASHPAIIPSALGAGTGHPAPT